jgi:mannose-1-phosphate guanylyltransferase
VAKFDKRHFYPVILAGGRGTRFWPLSRKRLAKQLLPLNSSKTMIQETVARLAPESRLENFWIISNQDLRRNILRQLPELPPGQVIAEPLGRNTAPAIGLAAFLLLRTDPKAVIGMFPSDHVIGDQHRFRSNLAEAVAIAAAGENIVVMGIDPTRPETGYGYIETGEKYTPTSQPRARRGPRTDGALRVRRFTEKPKLERAVEFLEAGNFFWNSGMFVWSAATLAAALREHLPKTAPLLEQIAAAYGTRRFSETFRQLYPKCENISVDYAVLEPRSAKGERQSNIFCIRAGFGWNDLGSWSALHEHRVMTAKSEREDGNHVEAPRSFILDAQGNYLHAPGRFVAAVGVKDLVVVVTDDALLVTTRTRAQDVGKIVSFLDENKLTELT